MKLISSILFVLLTCVCLSKGDEALSEAIDVSLINLIASPREFSGKLVRVVGYLHLEFEDNGIYLHKDDYDHNASKNGLWVSLSMAQSKSEKANDCYVVVEGVFFSERKGHMGAWSGEIGQVRRITISIPNRSQIR